MMVPLRIRLLSFAVLGVVLLPSLRQVDIHPQRRGGHRRHAAHARYVGCRGSSSDEARSARRAQRRAKRQMRRLQERARIEAILMEPWKPEASPPGGTRDPVSSPGEGAAVVARQSGADQASDDSDRLKRKRRRARAANLLCFLDQRPKALPDIGLLNLMRLRVDTRDARLRREAELIPHFGSGPCHSIPRPREGTIALTPPSRSAAA
jgi:hypothetical protein